MTYPYVVTIDKPSYGTVHLGFLFQFQAEMAQAGLRQQLTSTAHPDGTSITWGETPPGVEPLPPLPADPAQIAEAIYAEPDNNEPGANFPDLFARLHAQEGYDRAGEIWTQSCQLISEWEHAVEEQLADDNSRVATWAEYHEATAITARFAGWPANQRLLYVAAGLANEAGETVGQVKKAVRDDDGAIATERREAIIDELGDVLWYAARLAESVDATLADAAAANVTKVRRRIADGTLSGSGDR